MNHYINEWNQTHPDERMPKMHKLKKQILSIVEPSFRIRTINDETELFGTFDNIRTAEQRYAGMLESILENMNTADIYDKSGILVTSAERDSLEMRSQGNGVISVGRSRKKKKTVSGKNICRKRTG